MLMLLAAACAVERDRPGAPAAGVHAEGLLDAGSPGFHGALLRDRDWDFALCQGCHGDDFAGGTSGVSCRDCHTDADGPTSCTTCHDESTGAHPAHLVTAGVPCAECHVVPDRWDAPGHIVLADGRRDDAPAEVVLGALAGRDVTPPRRTEAARYDAATGTCSAVYCHGGTLGDSAATASAPRWDDRDAVACGGCHGEPPASHASARCASCHPSDAAHLDGTLDVGEGCASCHGDARSPAPPRGLGGETSPQVLAVGAHRAHLEGGSVRGPIACGECHQVPEARDVSGHLDSAEPAEVFPAGAGALARADGAVPIWDRASASCAGVYCHGGGLGLAADAAPGRVPAPGWTHAGDGEAACGTCHGLPPLDGSHDPALPISACTTCHPSVDAIGAIVFTTPETSEHLDGDVDLL